MEKFGKLFFFLREAEKNLGNCHSCLHVSYRSKIPGKCKNDLVLFHCREIEKMSKVLYSESSFMFAFEFEKIPGNVNKLIEIEKKIGKYQN